MPSPDSETGLITLLKQGDPEAIRQLYERYYRRMLSVASARLVSVKSPLAEPEGAVDSAFRSFVRSAQQGYFRQLIDADDLWQILVMMTRRKAGKLARYLEAAERDWKRTQHEGPPPGADSMTNGRLEYLADDREPPPEAVAEMAEQCRHLLNLLGERLLEKVALCKMEGYTVPETAGRLGISRATVERKLKLIRDIWNQKGVGP